MLVGGVVAQPVRNNSRQTNNGRDWFSLKNWLAVFFNTVPLSLLSLAPGSSAAMQPSQLLKTYGYLAAGAHWVNRRRNSSSSMTSIPSASALASLEPATGAGDYTIGIFRDAARDLGTQRLQLFPRFGATETVPECR